MKIFAVYNIKGGVGKTTTSVNLAYLASTRGMRTLLWDLDPQGSASFYFLTKQKIKGGSKALLANNADVSDFLRMTDYPNLDLLPADLSYRDLELHISQKDHPSRVFKRLIKPLEKEYDVMFIDCSPGLNMSAENIFQIVDVLLVPLIPTTLSLRAYNQLVRFLVDSGTKKVRVLPFFNQVNLEKPIHRVVTRNVLEQHPIFLRQLIPDSNVIESMGIKRAPLLSYARETPEAVAFQALWDEISARLRD
jgi:chromosome partitioning protein